jgi:hypothetical protein
MPHCPGWLGACATPGCALRTGSRTRHPVSPHVLFRLGLFAVRCRGRFGLGVSPSGTMVGSLVVVVQGSAGGAGRRAQAGGCSVGQYRLTSTRQSGVLPVGGCDRGVAMRGRGARARGAPVARSAPPPHGFPCAPSHPFDSPPPPTHRRASPQDARGLISAACTVDGDTVQVSFVREVAVAGYGISLHGPTTLAWAVGQGLPFSLHSREGEAPSARDAPRPHSHKRTSFCRPHTHLTPPQFPNVDPPPLPMFPPSSSRPHRCLRRPPPVSFVIVPPLLLACCGTTCAAPPPRLARPGLRHRQGQRGGSPGVAPRPRRAERSGVVRTSAARDPDGALHQARAVNRRT